MFHSGIWVTKSSLNGTFSYTWSTACTRRSFNSSMDVVGCPDRADRKMNASCVTFQAGALQSALGCGVSSRAGDPADHETRLRKMRCGVAFYVTHCAL